jgi:hypothetical protein
MFSVFTVSLPFSSAAAYLTHRDLSIEGHEGQAVLKGTFFI